MTPKNQLGKIIKSLIPPKKIALTERALRNAGIGILIQDERWSRLFTCAQKTPSIIKAEAAISSRLDEKTRLHMEGNMLAAEKQVMLGKIAELTQKTVNNDNESALHKSDEYEAKLREINERETQIELRNTELDAEINEHNLELLENTVSYLYKYMKKTQARVAELETQIADMRELLKNRISERETLDESVSETYHFLHGLLGGNQIDSIDDHFTLE